MTVKIMISIPDDLKKMVDDYNIRNPFEKLNISQISQKAIHEKIRAEDPDLINRNSIKVLQDKPKLRTKAPCALKEVAPPKSVTGKEYTCIYCQALFTAKNPTAKCCSAKCRVAYRRRKQKEV